MTIEDASAAPRPGWYALLLGDRADLDDWCRTLNDPFDPVAEKLPNDRTALRSADFGGLTDAEAVRTRALTLIARLNGALAITNGTRLVRFGGILQVEDDGRQHTIMFIEAASLTLRLTGRGTLQSLGPDGNPLPPQPPQPSNAQVWNELAGRTDDISDMLDHFGRADNWYDIYKTIEIAAHAVGGKHNLWKLMAPEAKACRRVDQIANYYRHARGVDPPENFMTLGDARSWVAWIIRRVFDHKLKRVAESR